MNIRSKDVLSCLPLLASVLGNKYGVQITIGGNKAYTDGNTIHIPSLPLECNSETISLARGYCDHESAHIRHTDFTAIRDANMDAVTFNLFNSIEDWRVERCISDIFPGCRQNLNLWIKKLLEDYDITRAGEKSPALVILEYVILTTNSWSVPEISYLCDMSRAKIQSFFRGLEKKIDDILLNARTYCPDTSSAINYALQLSRCIHQWGRPEYEDHDKHSENSNFQQTVKEFINSTGEQDSDNKNIPCIKEHKDISEVLQHNERDTQDTAQNCSNRQLLEDMFTSSPQDLPRHLGDMLRETLCMAAKTNRQHGRIEVASIGCKRVASLTMEEKVGALTSCNALRHRLHGLLQSQVMRRCRTGRMGKLYPPRLYRLSVGNPRVFRMESVQQGLDTAVHILMDTSGSMCGTPMYLAQKACFAVAKALENIKGVSTAVTAFPAIGKPESVVPLIRHGDRVTDRFSIRASGDTPLAPALWWTLQDIFIQKERRKIIIVLTDGVPNSADLCKDVINKIQGLGVEIYGIGILSDYITELLPYSSRTIKRLEDIAPAMFELLQSALLKWCSYDDTY